MVHRRAPSEGQGRCRVSSGKWRTFPRAPAVRLSGDAQIRVRAAQRLRGRLVDLFVSKTIAQECNLPRELWLSPGKSHRSSDRARRETRGPRAREELVLVAARWRADARQVVRRRCAECVQERCRHGTPKEFARERGDRAEVRRQVLVLLSDGLDNASHVSADEMADLARRVGASIYVVALTDPILQAHGTLREREPQRATYAIRALAQEAGGRIFFPTSTTELPAVYGAIARELASQYDLGYVPARPGGDGRFRRIGVRVLPPASGVARTRSGYQPPRDQPGSTSNQN